MDDGEQGGKYIVRMATVMTVMVAAILGIVLYANKGNDTGRTSRSGIRVSNISESAETQEDQMAPAYGNRRTSDELDIWDEDYTAVLEVTPQPTKQPEGNDITTDGNHTMITYQDGSTEWVTISTKIPHNDYMDAAFVYQTPVMKYYADGMKSSYMGVMIEEAQKYVDYVGLKEAGVDFVMICVGKRDEKTGELKADAQFSQNMKNALDEELQVGVWFCSQAKNADEAKEEAEFVLAYLKEYEVTYPVACVFEASEYGDSRTEELGKAQRTENALIFMEAMEEAGYGVMLGANKEYLILKFDLTELEEYRVWLMQPGDVPDYPYFFSMWSYDAAGTIEGVAGDVGLLISMEDLSLRKKEK